MKVNLTLKTLLTRGKRMKGFKYLAMGTLLISTMAHGETSANTAASSAALTGLKSESLKGGGGKLFYIVDDYSELKALPGYSFGAPSGLVPGWGVAFASLAGTTYSDDTDGALALGGGFGDPIKYLGGAASLSIGSIDPSDGGAFNRGSLNLSVGRHIPKYGLGISVGVSNVDIWHETHEDELDPSYYGAVTKLFPNDIAPVIISAGMGSNAYADISKDKPSTTKNDRKHKWDEFVSGAVYIHPQMSLILDYTSGITTFGTSLVPLPSYPITVGLAAQDIFKEDEEVDSVKFLATVAVGYVF